MDANERRSIIKNKISKSLSPVTGSCLAAEFNVTRQVIVQDIAILRAGGENIIATPSGYLQLDAVSNKNPVKVFISRHNTVDEAENELLIIVDNGGTVRDVIIEHPVYGEITGTLMISTREAVFELIERLKNKNSQMLSSVTDGIHMHTIEARDLETLTLIEKKLKLAGILIL